MRLADSSSDVRLGVQQADSFGLTDRLMFSSFVVEKLITKRLPDLSQDPGGLLEPPLSHQLVGLPP